jgi:hypothetical protein
LKKISSHEFYFFAKVKVEIEINCFKGLLDPYSREI